MFKFCSSCGERLVSGRKCCPHCGFNLADTGAPSVSDGTLDAESGVDSAIENLLKPQNEKIEEEMEAKLKNALRFFEYSENDGTYTIKKVKDRDSLEGKVIIPKGVTHICEKAFEHCEKLTEIVLPEGLLFIGDSAFGECERLTDITIPSSVTSIGKSEFWKCNRLKNITISKDNATYHSNGNCIIETASKILLEGCSNSVIPDDGSVTVIGAGAFDGCENLTSITIPNGVISIGEGAFYKCGNLTSVNMQNGVEDIGEFAFFFCERLMNVTIPDSVTRIGNYAFFSCSSLTSATIPNNIKGIGEGAFLGCSSLTLTSVTLSGDAYVGDFAFPDSCRVIRKKLKQK